MGKGYRRRPTNLCLHQYRNKNIYCNYSNGHSSGYKEDVYVNEEFLNLKNYILSKFMDPVINKKYKELQENFFNFEYIEQKLNSFDLPKLSEEVELLKKVVIVMKSAIETRFTIDKANKTMFGDGASNLLLVETSRIVLKAKYEIYIIIFGNPTKDNSDFKPDILNEIQKHLDNNPGCTVSYIKSKLRNNFEELFI